MPSLNNLERYRRRASGAAEPAAEKPSADIERAGPGEDVAERLARLPSGAAAVRAAKPSVTRRSSRWLPAVLGVVAVLLGGLAVWFNGEANNLRSGASVRNVALTDTARTSEVMGEVTDAVNVLFSYDYANIPKTDQAIQRLLTGRAVQEYENIFAVVRTQAPIQKLILTTTVTDGGVELLDGDHARLLLFADQRSTSTTSKNTSYSAAMVAVDAVRQGGTWKIASIDTFAAPR
jgi:Mce-associated membrane protein